jgi:hypothetical protein
VTKRKRQPSGLAFRFSTKPRAKWPSENASLPDPPLKIKEDAMGLLDRRSSVAEAVRKRLGTERADG